MASYETALKNTAKEKFRFCWKRLALIFKLSISEVETQLKSFVKRRKPDPFFCIQLMKN